jgi:hypothetical protein
MMGIPSPLITYPPLPEETSFKCQAEALNNPGVASWLVSLNGISRLMAANHTKMHISTWVLAGCTATTPYYTALPEYHW